MKVRRNYVKFVNIKTGKKGYVGRYCEDMTGVSYKKGWTVLKKLGIHPTRLTQMWLCRCTCGAEQEVAGCDLRRNKLKKCRNCVMADLRKRKKEYPTDDKHKPMIVRMYKLGVSVREIAEKKGVTKQRIYQILNEYNVVRGKSNSKTKKIEDKDNSN